MTENEAIKHMQYYKDHIKEIIDCYNDNVPEEYIKEKEAYDSAIASLLLVQQYREIGTVEECREAVEKQKPKKPEFYGDSEDGKLLCQNCGEDLWDLKECGFNNCPYCGQAIRWDENLEGME